jgi:hypothetical protein
MFPRAASIKLAGLKLKQNPCLPWFESRFAANDLPHTGDAAKSLV